MTRVSNKSGISRSGKLVASFLGLFLVISIIFYLGFSNNLFEANKPSVISRLRTEKQLADQFVEKCANVVEFRRCYTALFKETALNQEQEYLLATLREVQALDRRANDCHYVAHEITYSAIKKNVDKWMERLKTMDLYWCSTGFLHGTIVSLGVDKEEDFGQISRLDEFCQDMMRDQYDKNFIEESCYHSTGHVYIIENQGAIDPALEQCKLYSTENQRFHCYAGVFMESVQRDALVDHGLASPNSWKWEELERQEEICRKYSGPQATACWMEMWPLYKANTSRIKTNDSRLDKYSSLCSRAEGVEAQDWCYKYGVYVSVDNGLNFLSKGEYEHACDRYRDDKVRKTECVRYVTLMYMRSNSIEDTKTIKAICSNASLDQELICCEYFEAENKQQLKTKLTKVEVDYLACMKDK